MHGTMLFFSINSLIGAIFIAYFLPETKGKSYEEISKLLEWVSSRERSAGGGNKGKQLSSGNCFLNYLFYLMRVNIVEENLRAGRDVQGMRLTRNFCALFGTQSYVLVWNILKIFNKSFSDKQQSTVSQFPLWASSPSSRLILKILF